MSKMKYNDAFVDNGSFDNYISYLSKVQNKLSKELYDFVSNENRHNFSKESLHDSWLESIEINADFEKKTAIILLKFLGAYHDRKFIIQFKDVSEYKITQGLTDFDRDLITFEIGFELNSYNEEKIVFRAEFAGEDKEIEIVCNDINIDEILLENNQNS